VSSDARAATIAKPGWAASARVVTAEMEKRTGKEARCCVLGHLQRGGSPTTFDRVLCSMFGAVAVDLIAAGDFGKNGCVHRTTGRFRADCRRRGPG